MIRILNMEENKKTPRYYFRLKYWESLFEWKIREYSGAPEYLYAWWRTRTKMIKKGQI